MAGGLRAEDRQRVVDLVAIAGAALSEPLTAFAVGHFLRYGYLPGGNFRQFPDDPELDEAVAKIEAGTTQAERQKALDALISNGQ